MKRYFKIVLVSLLVVSTMGKSAWASSTASGGNGLTGEEAMYYLKNTKGCINKLIMVYNREEKLAERRDAEKNLEGVAKHPLTRPIVEQAFGDVEKEIKLYKFKFEEAERSWWNDFFAIRKTYLGR
jgi:hypothetical protein